MAVSEFDELAKVLPERDPEGRFFWQPFVERIEKRFDGLPAPDGGESFVQGCVAAGCKAVGAIRRNTLWERQAPPLSDRRARGIFELRVRLGLFFAASLRYLVHGACRLRINIGDVEWHPGLGGLRAAGAEWHPVTGDGVSFREFLAGRAGEAPVVTWSEVVPGVGEVCVLAGFFFPSQEVQLLTPGLAGDVLAFAQPGRPRGLFGRMLGAEGQVEKEAVDVASVFLEALAEAVDQKFLRVNTRVNGHLFVTPGFCLLTAPIGLDCVTELLRTRRQGPRHDFTRHEVFRALRTSGCLAGLDAGDEGNAAQVYVVASESWEKPLELYGLSILSGVLPGGVMASFFEGAVTLKKENGNGASTG